MDTCTNQKRVSLWCSGGVSFCGNGFFGWGVSKSEPQSLYWPAGQPHQPYHPYPGIPRWQFSRSHGCDWLTWWTFRGSYYTSGQAHKILFRIFLGLWELPGTTGKPTGKASIQLFDARLSELWRGPHPETCQVHAKSSHSCCSWRDYTLAGLFRSQVELLCTEIK